MKRRTSSLFLILAGLLLLVMAACGGAGDENQAPPAAENANTGEVEAPAPEEPEEAPAEPAPELSGDPIRGGLLYDKWWNLVGADAPEDDHPLWATQDSNTRSGDDTWRCKECHGWDYKGADGAYGSGSHFTGFAGVIQLSGGDPNAVLAALKGETNPDHDFSTVMDEQALIDLSLFIAGEIVNYSDLVGDDKMAISGDAADGESLYQDACTDCHGPEGLAINFGKLANDVENVGVIAKGNPWEFLHKIRFGQPGTAMPSAVDAGWTMEELAAVLAFAQTLPEENIITQGGQLWDKWWKALDLEEPTEDHPLWATQDSNTREGADTWRCKECHGWDYKGADGAYGSGSHFTGFTGVLGSEADLLSWLDGSANADHDFSAYMDEAAMNMLVAFMQEGIVDVSEYINDDKSVNGDPVAGQALYEVGCSRCHGAGGQGISFGDDYLGDLALDNPWEVMHKAANGQPATEMPSGRNYGWSWQDIADVVAYLQSLVSE